MPNVKDDDLETLEFADESEYIGDGEDYGEGIMPTNAQVADAPVEVMEAQDD